RHDEYAVRADDVRVFERVAQRRAEFLRPGLRLLRRLGDRLRQEHERVVGMPAERRSRILAVFRLVLRDVLRGDLPDRIRFRQLLVHEHGSDRQVRAIAIGAPDAPIRMASGFAATSFRTCPVTDASLRLYFSSSATRIPAVCAERLISASQLSPYASLKPM